MLQEAGRRPATSRTNLQCATGLKPSWAVWMAVMAWVSMTPLDWWMGGGVR